MPVFIEEVETEVTVTPEPPKVNVSPCAEVPITPRLLALLC